jgi:hypothetical protein
MIVDVEFWISPSVFLVPDCDNHPRVELFSFEIFQNPFEKFLPQYGIILIGTSFQTLHAHTSWFGPN